MSYSMHELRILTKTFPLVSSSVQSTQLLCFVHSQGQKSEQKSTTKKFVGFHNHFPLLTMTQPNIHFIGTSHRLTKVLQVWF